jgi:hypothetical protein
VNPRDGLDDVEKRNFLTLLRWVDSIKMDLRQDEVMWTGSIWLKIWTSGGLL